MFRRGGTAHDEAPSVSDANGQFCCGYLQILVNTTTDSVQRNGSHAYLIHLHGTVMSTLLESKVEQSSLDQFPRMLLVTCIDVPSQLL